MPVLIFLFLVAVLSVSPFSKKIENFLVTHKKIISRILMGISFLSVFLIFSNVPIWETWEMAIRLLWIILWIPIFAKVFSFGIAKKLMLFRKELGIRMWVLAFVHSTQYFLKPNPYMPWEQEFWFTDGGLSYIAWWAFASILVIAMTLTSNTFSLKNMWRYWKALHKTVYTVLLLSLLHVAFFQIQKQWHDFGTTLFLTLLPFWVYILGKMLEWNRIKIPVKMPAHCLWNIFRCIWWWMRP